jgi:hypothetical protein
MIEPPFVLSLPTRAAYATVMAVLFALFIGRVIGQILAATAAPGWLPPMTRWYSGLMPYRYLLPTQILFIVVMTLMTVGVARGTGPLGTPGAAVARWLVWASYVYALGMVVRSVRYALAPPDRRGVLIPIVFHFVLAAFLFTYASAATPDQGTRSAAVTRIVIARAMPSGPSTLSYHSPGVWASPPRPPAPMAIAGMPSEIGTLASVDAAASSGSRSMS